MTRVKRGTIANKKRKAVLKQTKGFKWGRKSKERLAKEALIHAYSHAFQGRKQKKRDFRSLWLSKISSALRGTEINYNTFISSLKKQNIIIDRKILSQIAETQPETWKEIVKIAQ